METLEARAAKGQDELREKGRTLRRVETSLAAERNIAATTAAKLGVAEARIESPSSELTQTCAKLEREAEADPPGRSTRL